MKRLLALVVAVGLVVGAWMLRDRVIDKDETRGTRTPDDAPTLICATVVRAACQQLAERGLVEIIRTEDPGLTLDGLKVDKPFEADGWLVSQPWPGMADATDRSIGSISAAIARSPAVLVVPDRRPTGLDCPQGVEWSCVVPFAESSPNFAYGTKNTTGGLLARHGIATGLIGRTDYASNDFEFTDGFTGRFGAVERTARAVTSGRIGNLVNTIQTAAGSYSAVAVLGADARELNDRFEALTPTPEITADVVLAGHPDRFDLDDIGDALFATGWLRSGDNAPGGSNGLPNPGVMVALRDLSR